LGTRDRLAGPDEIRQYNRSQEAGFLQRTDRQDHRKRFNMRAISGFGHLKAP
jgi:hypothetical protein